MYKYKISVNLKNNVDSEIIDSISQDFSWLTSSLYREGYTTGFGDNILYESNSVFSIIDSFEIFSKKLISNKDTLEYWKKLEKRSNSQLSVLYLGEDTETIDSICSCKDIPFYILFTHVFNELPPISCGNCFKKIPIYKIKKEENLGILNWDTKYKSLDQLYLGDGIQEKFAIEQLSDINSELTKQGLIICRDIEVITNKDVYYYLVNFEDNKYSNDTNSKCPSCDSDWLLEYTLHKLFNFKCDKCKILSNVAM